MFQPETSFLELNTFEFSNYKKEECSARVLCRKQIQIIDQYGVTEEITPLFVFAPRFHMNFTSVLYAQAVTENILEKINQFF